MKLMMKMYASSRIYWTYITGSAHDSSLRLSIEFAVIPRYF